MTEKNHMPDDAQSVGVPDGWKLVPLIPTERMIEVGCDNNPTQWNEGTDHGFPADVASDIYVSMVRAAQPPAAPVETGPQATRDEIQRLILIEFAGQVPESRRAAERIWNLIDARAKTLARRGTTPVLPHPEGQGKECGGVSHSSAATEGCGTRGCTDPNCEYGKGPLRCQSCGAVVVGEPQTSSKTEADHG